MEKQLFRISPSSMFINHVCLIISFSLSVAISASAQQNVKALTDSGKEKEGSLPFPDYNWALYTSTSTLIYSTAESELEMTRKAAEAFSSSRNLHGQVLPDTIALKTDLTKRNLYVFGTDANKWIQKYKSLLPIEVKSDGVFAISRYSGNDYRLLSLAPNPIDRSRVLLFFTAQQSQHLKDIDQLFNKNPYTSQYSVFKKDSLVEDGFIEYSRNKAVLRKENPYSNRLFTPRELQEDVNQLVRDLEAVHPNLYAYRSKEIFQKDLGEALRKLNKPMTRKAFSQIITPVVNTLQHGHTNLNLPWQDLDMYIKGGGTFIPFNTTIHNNKLFVASSMTQELSKGDEIISINSMPANVIIKTLRSYSNGEKNDFKDKWIGNDFHKSIWFLFKGSGVPFKIVYEDTTTRVRRTLHTKGVKHRDIDFKVTEVGFSEPFKMTYIGDSIAYLQYKLCTSYDEFKLFLKEHFRRIAEKHIQHLIIDIRDNPGGNAGVNTLLFNYLTDQPYKGGEQQELKVSFATLLRSPWIQNSIREGNMAKDSMIVSKDMPLNPEAVTHPFRGKAYLLTSPITFSSANMFASTFKCNKFGIIIGEETGGVTVSYGDSFPVFLNHTKLCAGIATIKFFEACGVENGRGVIPDYIVPDKRINGTDEILNFCLKLIQQP